MNLPLRALWLAALTALSASAGAQAPSPAPQKVAVNEISVLGNTLLPAARIEAVLAPFKGERSIAEIREAARVLQELYREAGYGAVVTFLPEQAVAGGKLVIGVLEGRLARVAVIGAKRFTPENVRRAVPALAEGQTPQVKRIDGQVLLANDNPARKLAVTLEPGGQRGEVDATVNVTEAPVSRWVVSAENTGSRQTGRLRLGLGYQHAALWDRDHQLSLQAQTSPEHPSAVRIFSGSYRVPLYGSGLLLNAYGTYSSVDAGSTATAAGALQFNGRGRVWGLSAQGWLPRVGEYEQRLALILEARDYLNNCSIEGLPDGACGSAGESVKVHPLTLEYTLQRGGDRPLGLTAALAHNLSLGGQRTDQVGAVRPGAAKGYTVLRLQAFGAVPLPGNWQVSGRATAQATGDALIPGEQFGLAGTSAVRGYEEREVTGDSGLAASLEFLTPDIGGTGLRGVFFADAGTTHNRLGQTCDATQVRCSLSALGLGARFALGPSVWKFDVARAMQDGRGTDRGSVRLHFQASMPFQ